MELRFGEKEEKLRLEVRSFLLENNGRGGEASGAELGSRSDDEFEFAKGFNQKLAQRGWIAPAWPKEYGGLGASIYEQMVFNEEFGYWGAPDTGTRGFGVGMIGPTLIIHGNEEQKKNYLPKITSGEHIWCQGYSEPGAGSDLASLQTRATRDGDDFIINGQKIWTSGGHRSNQMFCLVRTDPEAPKHRGISFLLIDDIKNTPGLTVRPLINMANRHHFNEVFFEDVRVPARNLIGEENRGWYVGMTLLDFERSGIGTTASQKRTLEELARDLREGSKDRREQYRTRLADHVVSNNVGRFLGYRIGYIQANGMVPNYEASVVKIFQSELGQKIYNFGVNMLGLSGQMMPEEPRAPMHGALPESHLMAVPSTIYSGSNEIQRNIISTRGLGLPRG
ncbi:MAG: acyl-CoA dehydrogenase family protein [Dehalococcoidia bacterium]|jgi:alkylation response protein AidB-like acyl-CoA dehydrogenase|uniref:acyl-CoA dehydrogenase family protein n=1 Tax=Candidatus Amarobacter glycogenicus TaxID=3140699 RepID=UPI0031364AE9|nr:acyl-CoA dehydrogenase family protein [Dehalococcoidia bacterium]MBK6559996.1 acyl-CoA dehydrogenase family protein [Dehalococcoidia bacterium]MBK7330613.1 acyl-CoA dehydrogenase family protein [Dehalococcoidia bacterium]MBK8559173.1 acyl-CoA dehydrogenase family protein [Dehalococcoidia bacterium]MBK9546028.1 acyl-CoA dehydrogenase family protein [Dehalococcoidia bacterium]